MPFHSQPRYAHISICLVREALLVADYWQVEIRYPPLGTRSPSRTPSTASLEMVTATTCAWTGLTNTNLISWAVCFSAPGFLLARLPPFSPFPFPTHRFIHANGTGCRLRPGDARSRGSGGRKCLWGDQGCSE